MTKIILKEKEPTEVKIIVCLPYKKGTEEYKNAIQNLKEFSYENSQSIGLYECEMCEECGAINDTVERVKEFDNEKLCDYCFRTLVEE